MNDSDHPSIAAEGPHHETGSQADDAADPPDRSAPSSEIAAFDDVPPDTMPARRKPERQGLFMWLREAIANRGKSTIRAELTEALEDIGSALPDSFSASERALLQNVLKLRELRVDDVMVPRADIDAVDADDTLADLILCFRNAGHSRLPVYEDTLDNIIGFIHIKDALQHLTAETPTPREGGKPAVPVKMLSSALRRRIGAEHIARKVLFVPPSMPVQDLLQQMQATHVHMAIVVDEYGGTDGLVSIEDLLESVVGDIEDEHDEDDGPLVRKVAEGIFIADARVELTELQDELGPDFDPGQHIEDVDTLGGLLFDLEGRVPVRGEVITRFKGFEFEILAADARRIRRVRIVVRKRADRARPATRKDEAAPEKG
jgi:CBS domain containing-hemolysin-like protein